LNIYNKFSCFILGEGTLPIRCAEILLERGHTIYGMISSDPTVKSWAQEREIPHSDLKNEAIVTFLSRHTFDYLFSIVNTSFILPQQVLALPHRCAINYHDAPLPRYAGLYVTSWAILQGERAHGVTWHAMTDLVNGGDIFMQALFELTDDETAFTLNAKCYDAAVGSFAELIDDLTYDRVSARKQNLNERSFFPLSKRPPSGCLLSWNRSARDIDAFVRALDFGPYPNPMGLPKLAIGRDFIIVSEIEVLNSMSTAAPGTVTHIDASCVRVATRDNEIALRKLLTIDGQPLPMADFVAKFGLYKGYQFKELDQEVAARITAYNASIYQHEAFWTKQLETLENITLPNVHQKTSYTQTARHSYVSTSIPTEILSALKNRYAPWPIGDVLLAAYAAYLARIGGVWSFDIGFRDIELKSDLAGLEGFFAAYVPLHVIIEYKQRFEEVFHAVQEQIKLAKQKKTYARDIMARYPILRSKANSQGVHLPSNCVERVETLHDYKAPHDSELTLAIRGDGGECLWAYNTEVLDEESVVQMQQGFTTFLQGIVSDPQQRISDLPLLTQKERQQMLVEWNATQAAYPSDKCVHQLFEAQVERSPDALAVVYKDEQVTYRELNRRANQLAHYLQKLGIGPEVLVGICVERSTDMVVGLLGVLKAGGAYVPLDPTYPAERLAFILQDAQAPMLLTQRRLASALPAQAVRPVYLDSDWDIIAQESEANPANSVQPANLAYVIYTSGSTGKPKGVMIPHLGFVNYLSWCTQAYRVAEGQGTLVHSPLGFDLTITSLFSPLLVGQRAILLPEDQGIEMLQTALRNGRDFTLLKITPAHVKLLSQELSAQEVAGRARALIIGGEALLGEDISFWHTYAPGTRLINEYGPTETVVGCCIYEVPAEASLPGTIPIGRPIANTQLYLLDSHLQPVPINVPGELYIGGAGVARGYLNRPELTAERFIPDPFNQQPGARLYKTGDFARYLSDGNIEFLGRIDHQVKIRGFRIELGEIETVLELHPAVRQAVVVAREDTPGDKRLVAYVVLHEKQTATVGDLKSYVMKKVPTYMVPSALVLLETLPLTPNGKVDRRGLPAPEHTRPELGEAFVAARTSIEEVVTGIWSQALGIEQIGIHDDFFALGGDSLLAILVITRLRKVLQVQLSLARFLEARTIAKLSKIIEQVKAGDAQLQLQGRCEEARADLSKGAS
jgi:surfactin family lipopeptide synthetase A